MKVLIAIDHSEASEAVVREVAARPWPPNSSMEILNVVEPAHLWSFSQSVEATIELSTDLVHRAAEELRAKGLEASGLSLNGDAKRVILDRAKETKADFIFVGSQGVSALAHFLLGNVAAAVASHAPCSVEIVRKKDGKPGVHKILLATDGSEFSDRAARSIAERPWPEGTEVGVLSVVELVMGSAQALFEPPYVDSEQLEPLREAAMKRAQDAVASAVEILSKTFPEGFRIDLGAAERTQECDYRRRRASPGGLDCARLAWASRDRKVPAGQRLPRRRDACEVLGGSDPVRGKGRGMPRPYIG